MEIIIILILIILNGTLSMSEIALVSARKSRLEADAKRGSKTARTALKLANEPDRFLSTIQIGITLIGILTGLYSGESFAGNFAVIIAQIEPLAPYSLAIAKIIIVTIVTYLTLIIGELVPKRIGMAAAERVARIVSKPMYFISKIAAPFVILLTKSTALVLKLLGINPNEEGKVTEDEIKAIIREGTEDGEVQEVEQDIVERVFNLGDRNVGSIMTHRNELTLIDISTDKETLKKEISQNFYHVYPVSDGKLDHVVGILQSKDLFGKIDSPDFSIWQHIIPPHYIPETMSVYNALEKMKKERIKYGLVTDEFGSIQGIVTSGDIMEALLGALPELGEEPDIVVREDGSCLVDGQCSFYDFLAHFDLEGLYNEYNYNTLSGLILGVLEHIPTTGEKFQWQGFEFEIVDMDSARIDKVLATRINDQEEDE